MWDEKKSIALSKLGVLIFMLLILAAAVFAPWMTAWLINYSQAHLAGKELVLFDAVQRLYPCIATAVRTLPAIAANQ